LEKGTVGRWPLSGHSLSEWGRWVPVAWCGRRQAHGRGEHDAKSHARTALGWQPMGGLGVALVGSGRRRIPAAVANGRCGRVIPAIVANGRRSGRLGRKGGRWLPSGPVWPQVQVGLAGRIESAGPAHEGKKGF
jgi:hypothetical protein